MDRPPPRAASRRSSQNHYGPVVWIVMLLVCWFVIAEWDVLPEAIRHTMASLP